MADIKISEMTELEPTTTGDGVSDSDYLTIVDQSEPELTQANKKVRVSTLHEFLAPLDSPQLTGIPTAPTAPIGENSIRLATTAWVKNEFGTLSLNDLSDVTNPGTPQANQILVYNDITGTFQPQSPTTTNREVLTGTKVLNSASALYQFLDPNGSNRDIVLPIGQAGLRFVIKNLDTSFSLFIKETPGGPIEATININSPIAEVVNDGVEYHILQF